MAQIQWHGTKYTAEPVKQLDNGDWLMVTKEHGPRFTVGTTIQVKQADIVSMAAAEMPDVAASAAALEQGLAAERKTIPTVQEVLARQKQKDITDGQEAPR